MEKLELMHGRILSILEILRVLHNHLLIGKNKMAPYELSNHQPMHEHSLLRRILHLHDDVLCDAPCDVLCGVLYDVLCGVLYDDLYDVLCDGLVAITNLELK